MSYRSHILPPPHTDRPSLVALAISRSREEELRVQWDQDARSIRWCHAAGSRVGRLAAYERVSSGFASEGFDGNGE